MSKALEVIPHKSTDKLDVPFRIKGLKLRWLAPQQTEHRMGGTWQVLRPSSLDPETLKKLKEMNSFVFANGDTVRFHELVLGFVTEDQGKQMRKENKEKADEQINAVRKKGNIGQGQDVRVTESTISKGMSKEFFNNE